MCTYGPWPASVGTYGGGMVTWGVSAEFLDPRSALSLMLAMSNRHGRLPSPPWAAPPSGIRIVRQLA